MRSPVPRIVIAGQYRHAGDVRHVAGVVAGAGMRDAAVDDARIIVMPRVVFAVHFDKPGAGAVAMPPEPGVVAGAGFVEAGEVAFGAAEAAGEFNAGPDW